MTVVTALGVGSYTISEFLGTETLYLVCHAIRTTKVQTLHALQRSLGMTYSHRDSVCPSKRHAGLRVTDAMPGSPFRAKIVPSEMALVQDLFLARGYVTTNAITGLSSTTLHFAVSATHATLDSRGSTADACVRGRLVRACRRRHTWRYPGMCDVGCDVHGDYQRSSENDARSVPQIVGDRRIVLIRDDSWSDDVCVSTVSLLTFAEQQGYEVAMCASAALEYGQNVATLSYLVQLGMVMGVWANQSRPISTLGTHAYVPLRRIRSSLFAVSRCIAVTSLQLDPTLRARKLLHAGQEQRQIVRVSRIHTLVIAGSFTFIGMLPAMLIPRVYQCSEILVLGSLPRELGGTIKLSKNERVLRGQKNVFCQSVAMVPVHILVCVDWPADVSMLPLARSVLFVVEVAGDVDMDTIPIELLARAQTVLFNGVDVTGVSHGAMSRTGLKSVLSCLFPRTVNVWI